jgi:hypothetical protein
MLGPDRPNFAAPPAAAPASKPVLSEEQQRLLVRQFVARVGGMENAQRALELLALLKRAAASSPETRPH